MHNTTSNPGAGLVPAHSVSPVPSSQELDIIMRQAEMLAGSTIVPRDYQNKPSNVIAAALMGRSFGWDAMSSMRLITVIQGTASLKPEAMLALIRSRGHSVQITRHVDHVVAVGRRCDNGDTDTQRFGLDDAKRAGLDRNNTWRSYPLDMCQWRAVSRLARSLFSDVVLGAGYVPEEIALAKGAVEAVDPSDYINVRNASDIIVEAQVVVSVKEAKVALVEAVGGDKDLARQVWEQVRGDVGSITPLTEDEFAELLSTAQQALQAETLEAAVAASEEVEY